MKKLLYTSVVCIALVSSALAQESSINTGFGFGLQLNQYQKDFGIGLQATSPYFAKDRLAVRFRANFMFHEHLDLETANTAWTPYWNLTLGIISVGGYVNDRIRLYGEAGGIMILPSDEFSTQSTEFGLYGTFGFEFFMTPGHNYFIEIGGVGTGAKADKIPTNPIYSNGLMLSVGFRRSFQ